MGLVLYKREKLNWGLRRITILGFQFDYVTNIKRNYNCLVNSLDLFTSLSDITLLKKASGPLRLHQLKLTKFAKEIVDELNRHNIYPYLIAGSLIGQLRHKGFIPWDDDMDFSLPRDEYNKLIKYSNENFHTIPAEKINPNQRKEYFRILDREISKNQNKVVAVNYYTHFKILKGTSLADCVAFDVFPLEYMSESANINSYIQETKKIFGIVKKCTNVAEAFRKLNHLSQNSGLFSSAPTSKMYYGFDNLDATKRKHNSFYDVNSIYPVTQVSFEELDFYAPKDSVSFIKNMIGGDYMSYPSDVGSTNHLNEIKKNLRL